MTDKTTRHPSDQPDQSSADQSSTNRIRVRSGESPEPLAVPPAFPAKLDIWPRPPLEPDGFLDISTAAYDMPPGLPGMWVDTGNHDQISRIPEVDIPFCSVVAHGSRNGYCKLPGVAGDKLLGISVLDYTAGDIDPTTGAVGLYKANKWAVGIARRGRIWALAPAAVLVGDAVLFTYATGALGGAVTLPNAFWASAAGAGQMAVIELNLSN